MGKYAVKAGANIGDIMAQLVGGPGMTMPAYSQGVRTGTDARLASYQANKMSADTAKILDELKANEEARSITGVDLAEAAGVPRNVGELVSRGYDTMHPLPAGEMGPAAPASMNTAIDPLAISKVQRMNLLSKLHKMGGGNVQALTAATGGLQEQGLLEDMLAGSRKPQELLPIMAALKGKYAPTGGAAGRDPARIALMNHLTAKGLSEEDALLASMMDVTPQEMHTQVFRNALTATMGDEDAARGIADRQMEVLFGENWKKMLSGGKDKGTVLPSGAKIVRDYTTK